MRNLASIKTISKLVPIEGRDRIELAIIDGWSVIVKKDEFKVGDRCVYCEIDSVMPETEQFEFLRSKNFRIKTMKMAGVISQGICFPLSVLPAGAYRDGDNVTAILGITKYEPYPDKPADQPVKTATAAKYPKWLMRFDFFRNWIYRKDHREAKGFPSFINKTDEVRVQNMPWILNNKDPWIATEKIDGQSGTFALVRKKSRIPFKKPNYEYIVCSRNLRLYNKDKSSYWSVSDKYGIDGVLRKLIGTGEWVAIQGECISPSVQGNKYKVREPDLYVFNVIYPTGRLGSTEARDRCAANGLKFVPILDTEYVLPDTIDEILSYAHGNSEIGDTIREGIVFRTQDGKQSFKAVDPLFLIQYDE